MKRDKGKGSIDLMEEAVQLLRLAPAKILFSYFIGTLPFVLAFLYFWADMSKSPFAASHVSESAFGLALLFVWMKVWQSIFVTQLKSRITGTAPPVFSARRILKIIGMQTLHQPAGLFLLPLSISFCAFGWLYAYYQNLLLTANGDPFQEGSAWKAAWKQAKLWPGQNHTMLAIVSLLWLFIFLNVGISIITVPALLNTLFGVETVFTRSGWGALNTTYIAIVLGVTHLCLDPFIKAFYVLRCFYGEAVDSAADLKSDLRSLVVRTAAVIFIFLSVTLSASAAEQPKIPATQLNQSIQDEIGKREYQWRLPRQHEDTETHKGIISQFFEGITKWMQQRLETMVKLYRRFREWLRTKFPPMDRGQRLNNGFASGQERMLLWLLSGAVVLVLLFLIWRYLKERKKKTPEVFAEPVSVVPDLRDENLLANQLPEEGWHAMARDLLARGELRLALRALYMATLAHLGKSGLITIAKYKSNCEYHRELQRRARERNAVLEAFGENVSMFERSWYGNHEVTAEILQQFGTNHDQIMKSA